MFNSKILDGKRIRFFYSIFRFKWSYGDIKEGRGVGETVLCLNSERFA